MEKISELGRHACQSLSKRQTDTEKTWIGLSNTYLLQIQGVFQRKIRMRGDSPVSFALCFVLNMLILCNQYLQESFG